MARGCRRRHRIILVGAAVLLVTVSILRVDVTEAQTQTQTYTCAGGFTEEVAPPILLTSLSTVINPVLPKDPVTGAPLIREDLTDYIANLNAAIRLGKALFWDMQAGSDQKTACATCHFHAGQDGRTRNQLHPGANAGWDQPGFGANADLWPGAFPFTLSGISDTDNIAGSQGVRRSTFQGVTKTGGESTSSLVDPVFSVDGNNVRQVTGRNAPSVVNAVFNHRNFHDGRAQAEFNGVNPFGDRDASARVWFVGPLGPTQIDIHIPNASLASQAVGPVLNAVEMSAAGRTFPDVGKKLLGVKPLALQKVHPSDSVLGPIADPMSGLTVTYKSLLQQAFKPKWWNSTKSVRVDGRNYTMMEANFALFWGLSVMLYEATLVSDQSPMDQYLRSRAGGAADAAPLAALAARLQGDLPGVTSSRMLNGLRLFELPPPPAPAPNGVGCLLCHVGAELTSASSRNMNHGVEPGDIAFQNAGFEQRLERMFMRIPPVPPGTDTITLDPMAWTVTAWNSTTPGVPPADAPVATYDTGYYNIGVRPTADDPGTDRLDPFGVPWSIVRMLQTTILDPSYIKVPGAGVNCGPNPADIVRNSTGYPLLSGSLRKKERVAVAGSFKVPGLRNVEFTAPYFHNGGKATLMQVVETYDNGGDFANATLAPLIRPLGMTAAETEDLVAFLLALTDDRVRLQQAPFDHPQLFVPNGDSVPGTDNAVELPAVGADGGAPLPRFLNLNPFSN
jgi:cytochrome c peroxidase